MKRNTVVFLTTLGAAAILGGCGVKQTADAVTVEAGQELQLAATDFFDVTEEKAGSITFDASKVDVNKVGEYEVSAVYKNDTYTIKVAVEDTVAPAVKLKQRYAFVNDIASYDPAELVERVEDVSEYTVTLARFEKTGALEVLDDTAVKALTDAIITPAEQEALAEVGSEEIPTEEGIYRTILAVEDVQGNKQLEEVYMIFDKTGAVVEGLEDTTLEVDTADLEREPEMPEVTVTDNADGVIDAADVKCRLKLTDEENHQYTVTVSYTDRAGNKTKEKATITLKEKPQVVVSNENSGSNGGSRSSDLGGGNSGSTDTSDTQNIQPAETIIPEPVPEPIPEPEESSLTPAQQAAVNAGYYNIVPMDGGGYIVMVHDGEYDYGYQLLKDYLTSLDLTADMGGSWINIDKDQYGVYTIGGVRELIDENDEEFWD